MYCLLRKANIAGATRKVHARERGTVKRERASFRQSGCDRVQCRIAGHCVRLSSVRRILAEFRPSASSRVRFQLKFDAAACKREKQAALSHSGPQGGLWAFVEERRDEPGRQGMLHNADN